MRKILLFSLTLSVAILTSSSTQAADQVDLKDLIKKAVKAHGGVDKLKKYKAVEQQLDGTLQIMGQDVKFTGIWYFQPPGQVKSEMTMNIADNNISVVNVFNKDKGWISFNNMTQAMPEDLLKAAKNEMEAVDISNLYPLLGDKYKLSLIGDEKVAGKPAVGITVSRKGMKDVQIYLDKKTNHLVKLSFNTIDAEQGGKEIIQDMIFGDYKTGKNGLAYPTTFSMKREGKDFLKAKVTKYTAHEKLDDSVFAKP